MEAFAGGDIDLDAEAFLGQSLGCHQVQGVETSTGIVINEKVDIAFGIGFVASG